MRTAEWMLPAQCTATISSCQRFAGVQVPVEHSCGSFLGRMQMLVSYMPLGVYLPNVDSVPIPAIALRYPETTYAAHLTAIQSCAKLRRC